MGQLERILHEIRYLPGQILGCFDHTLQTIILREIRANGCSVVVIAVSLPC